LGPFVVVHVLTLAVLQGYDFSKTRTESDVAFSAFWGILTGTVAAFLFSTMAILYYAPGAEVLPRSVFALAAVLNCILLPGWRVWYTWQRRKRGELTTRVLIAGKPARVKAVGDELGQYSRSGHEIVGCVADTSCAAAPEDGFLGSVEDLSVLTQKHGVEEVIVIGESIMHDAAKLARVVELGRCAKVHVMPGFYEAMVGNLDLYEVGGLPLIELKTRPASPWYATVKRGMDLLCAVLGLVVGLPVLLWAAVAIKRDSPGPVFYRQVRCGKDGKEFEILKLRTMHVDAEKESGPVWASKEDPRVTPLGKFLRSKRIDEIPQLWNVLKGDMSLVGPRPERPHFVNEFSAGIPLFPMRMLVKPGVTSLSHVWGRYDSTPADRLLYDLVYIGNLSLMLDIRIIIDTVKTVITGRGAQ
ncbi:MAG TPA: sugar transferase, partial [Candidatus Hydrogenedentes bacterium]|nr:sugar transferase [Candidatus Hydrogenedentota bacterium]